MRITEADLADLERRTKYRRATPQQVAVADTGRIVAWVPGQLRNPLNGSQGTTRAGRIARAKERAAWRERTELCIRDAATRAGIVLGTAGHGQWWWHPRAGKILALTAYVWNLYDEDGLHAALKPCVDGCRDAGVIHDDGPAAIPAIHRVETRQTIDRRHRGVEIVIEPRGHER